MRISDWSSDVCSSDLPVLSSSIKEALGQRGVSGTVLNCLRRGEPEIPTIGMAVAGLYVGGYELDWRTLIGGDGRYEIGRASCRERVCSYVLISVVAVTLKKKTVHI